MRDQGNLPTNNQNLHSENIQPDQLNRPIQHTAEEFYNTIDANNYDKISSIYMAHTENGYQPQRLPEPPSYPVFDENGRLIKAGDRGGQYNPIKYADMNTQMNNNQFDYGGGGRYQLSQNEIIRFNIEKLGGLNTTIDSKSLCLF